MEHIVSDETLFICGQDQIKVQVENTIQRFAWRIGVNDDWSNWTQYYEGILTHKGYGLVTAFYDPEPKEFVPFKLVYAERQ